MDMTGEVRLPAPREMVWRALNDPEILKQSIPGCEEIQKLSDTEMTARIAAKVGPVSARFSGKVTLSDLDPPNGYTISGEGQGGVAGFAKGGAQVSLKDDSGGTMLAYKVQAQVGGKLAQIGSRLIDATARKMADEFFTRFAGAVSAAAAPVAAAAGAPTGASPAMAALPSDRPVPTESRRVPPFVWAAILTGLVALLLYLYARG
ncbi:MAG TPA: carbon monoxide dehydrogenase subunit G [Stellaceae bacterium]|nr:carbon monoxide dehydrogenase subunit G [Stellaceae bacterium]